VEDYQAICRAPVLCRCSKRRLRSRRSSRPCTRSCAHSRLPVHDSARAGRLISGPLSSASDVHHAPTDEEFRPRGVAGVGGREERRCGYLLRIAEPTQRNPLLRAFLPALQLLLGRSDLAQDRRLDEALMTFTRTLRGASSAASVRAKERTAALLAEYPPKNCTPNIVSST
jgi:hypothetical protein